MSSNKTFKNISEFGNFLSLTDLDMELVQQKKKLIQKLKKTISFTVIGILILSSLFVFNEASLSIGMFKKDTCKNSNKLFQKTLSGRSYYHDTTIDLAENGTLIYINTNEEEFRKEWQKRSSLNIEGKDKKGNNLWYTARKIY
jgi:hypothetical protein